MATKWISVNDEIKDTVKSKKRFMAYSPQYGGYVFRCWLSPSGFGSDSVMSMIDDVTHYRAAKKQEKDRQLSKDELMELEAVDPCQPIKQV